MEVIRTPNGSDENAGGLTRTPNGSDEIVDPALLNRIIGLWIRGY
jgi:hypothetical protein